MTSLDHCVHQDIRSVLYACDVPQNSHFTRYAQFNHTLVTAFSSLASQPILTNNLALYDRILAPDMATADQWRATSPDDIKSRVSVILEGYSALPSHVSTQTALSFFWHSALLNDDLAVEEISTYLTRMIEATCTAKSMHLKIWFPDTFAPNAQRLHAARHRLQKAAYAVDPNSETISIHAGSEADSANSADLVICTRSSNIDALMSAGKPLVTMSTGYSSADDLPELAPTEASIANAMATALSGAPKQPPRRHFLSFEALCATLPETPDLRAVA